MPECTAPVFMLRLMATVIHPENPDAIHETIVANVCAYACRLLKHPQLTIKVMRRRGSVNTKNSYVLGHTSIGGTTVTLDVYTARKRQPKKISSILSVLAHEIAHHQKPPYRQRYRGKWIWRQHYPAFYTQVNKNMAAFKKDELLGKYFQ